MSRCCNFQLLDYGHKNMDGEGRVHARLRTKRHGKPAIIGVFQLTELEWQELKACCEEMGVEVLPYEEVEG